MPGRMWSLLWPPRNLILALDPGVSGPTALASQNQNRELRRTDGPKPTLPVHPSSTVPGTRDSGHVCQHLPSSWGPFLSRKPGHPQTVAGESVQAGT